MPSIWRLRLHCFLPFWLAGFSLMPGILSCRCEPSVLRIAITTSMANLGLAEILADDFTRETGIRVQWVVLPSAQALESLARGDVQGAFSHSPEMEESFRRAHPGLRRHAVWISGFVIIGPASDPANVRSAASPADAFSRIARSGAAFVSRGDRSGTSEFERKTLALAGIAWPKSIETGRGALETLLTAAERDAYTLVPLSSWLQFSMSPGFRSYDCSLLYFQPETMSNPYAFYTACHEDSASCRGTHAFAAFLAGPRARALVQSFTLAGQAVFRRIEVP